MTNIQWTDVTDNPIVVEGGGWWCRKVSEGCANCYAEKLNHNTFFGGNHSSYSGQPPATLKLKRELIASWAKMRSPKKHFVGSMTDIFGEWVPMEWHLELLDGMAAAPKQTFQLLTKRPGIMAIAIGQWLRINKLDKLPDNVWVGTSVENQKRANYRIPVLNQIPASVKFLSAEPLLERVNLGLDNPCYQINWVIVGGESGNNARPCRIEWLEEIVSDCIYANVPVFVKQLGSNFTWLPLQDKKGGDIAEFPNSLKIRQFPT